MLNLKVTWPSQRGGQSSQGGGEGAWTHSLCTLPAMGTVTYPLKSANEISNVSQASLFGQHGVEIGLFNVLFSMPLLFGQSLSLPTQEVASHAYPMTAGFLSLLLMYCQHFHRS